MMAYGDIIKVIILARTFTSLQHQYKFTPGFIGGKVFYGLFQGKPQNLFVDFGWLPDNSNTPVPQRLVTISSG